MYTCNNAKNGQTHVCNTWANACLQHLDTGGNKSAILMSTLFLKCYFDINVAIKALF